jgi:phosphoenolpyruvate carboxykinase (GTP)
VGKPAFSAIIEIRGAAMSSSAKQVFSQIEPNRTYYSLLKRKMDEKSFTRLTVLENEKLFNFIGEWVEICDPDSVFMCDDSDEDAELIRRKALEKHEESRLAKPEQTVHYDGYGDQGRAPGATKFMVAKEHMAEMGGLPCVEHQEGLAEIKKIANGIMRGKEAIVKLSCECPTKSPFSIGCAQLTDSFYVAHSEDLLYRRGYEHFKNMKPDEKENFFCFCHSAGRLDEHGCSIDLDKRRIYQDLETLSVYSMNNQYAGNSVGLKKHAMRLAIRKSGGEGWLCEHMFILGCQNREKKRATYFCGAYPSACGKTATAMLPGESIVGDDIAYFRNINGEFRGANVERGIFGIIRDVNAKDDPVIFKTLMEPHEMIFSNVLTGPDKNPYWLGMGVDAPKTGENHSGLGWFEGKKDSAGEVIPLAHPNSRYTTRLEYLENLDPEWDNKQGVLVSGIIYGGRDADTSVPVEESFSWEDGIITKACTLESETTFATIGKEGVRAPQPMANLDFISYTIGKYVLNNINFVQGIRKVPRIFAVNYFLRKPDNSFCTSTLAKKVWLHWAEARVHNEIGALETPTGLIPKYDDLRPLFKSLLGENYLQGDYEYEFSFRCERWMEKLQRSIQFFHKNCPGTPERVYESWQTTMNRIKMAKQRYGPVISPGKYHT